MAKEESAFVSFLKEEMRRRRYSPSRLAADLGVSHTTVIRWLAGEHIPSARACRKLAEYTGIPLEKIFTIVGYLSDSKVGNDGLKDWPEFRQYAHLKYADELDDELITMIEDLIERRRRRKYEVQKQQA